MNITDYTDNGKCSNCGECCSDFLPVSPKELIRIGKYVKQHNIKEQRHNGLTGVDFTCPFRDDKNRKCLIYSVRPAICGAFMCNHTLDDIRKTNINFHVDREPTSFRHAFFGNDECIEKLEEIKNELIRLGVR